LLTIFQISNQRKDLPARRRRREEEEKNADNKQK